jgi:hypothetical protein
MSQAKSTLLSMLAIFIILAGIPARAQKGYSFRSGQKYPSEKGIDLRKPIGPGMLDGTRRFGNSPLDRESCPGKPAMHEDSMISYSRYDGYTVKQIYTYSRKGYLEILLTQSWSGLAWENQEQSVFTNDHQGKVLSESVSAWDGSGWIEYLTFTYTYHKSGLLTSLIFHDIFGDFIEMVSMSYDNKGNRIRELGKYWDGEGYVNLEQYSYTYDKQGNRLTMFGQLWDGAAWVDYIRERWTWMTENKCLTDKIEFSDGMAWSNYLLYKNKYNHEEELASYTGSYWHDGSGWVVEFGGKYKYDAHGNRVSDVQSVFAWWEISPYWINQDSTAIKFRYREKSVTGTGYIWTGEQWVRGETLIYIPFNDNGNTVVFADEYPSNLVNAYYSSIKTNHDGGNDQDGDLDRSPLGAPSMANPVTVDVFPNPVSDGFRITLSTPVTEDFVINLLDSRGKLVQQVYSGELLSGSNQIEVKSIGSPAKGLYFLNAVSPSQSKTVKVIRQ